MKALLIGIIVRFITGILATCDIVDGIHDKVNMGVIVIHMDGIDDLVLVAIVGGGLAGNVL